MHVRIFFVYFFARRFASGFFRDVKRGARMNLTVIKNTNPADRDKYEIARAIYAETGAASLRLVEALASMIANAAASHGCSPLDVVRDENIFSAAAPSSPLHSRMSVDAASAPFQMCLRVTERMLRGRLPDTCAGATRCHHDGVIPAWATALGYVAEIDGMLFYA